MNPESNSSRSGSKRKPTPTWMLVLFISTPFIMIGGLFWYIMGQELPIQPTVSYSSPSSPAAPANQGTGPISFAPEAVTHDIVSQRIQSWLGGYWLADQESRAPDAQAFVLRALAFDVAAADGPSAQQMRDESQAIEVDAKADPVLAYIVGKWDRSNRPDLLREAVEQLSAKPKFEVLAYHAAVSYERVLSLGQGDVAKARAQAAATQALDLLRLCLESHGGFAHVDDWVAEHAILGYRCYRGMNDRFRFFDAHHSAMSDVVLANPDVEPWLKHLIEGKDYVEKAWEARGGGYASTVTNSQWQRFNSYLEDAHSTLEQAYTENPDHPSAAASLITVEMGRNHDDFEELRHWFDCAVNAQVDYVPAYTNLLWGMRPRWGGSHDQIVKFGEACLDTHRFDTASPWWLIQAHRDCASEWDLPHYYYIELRGRDTFQKLFDGYLNSAEREPWRAFDQSQAAAFWYMCQEYDRAWPLLQALEFQLDPRIQAEWNLYDMEFLRDKTAAFVSPAGPLLKDAEVAENGFNARYAADYYRQGLETAGVPEDAKPFIRDRLAMMELEAASEGGNPVIFLPGDDGSGWVQEGEHWKFGKDELTWQGGSGLNLLTSLSRLGPVFEITGEVLIEPASPDSATTAMITYGYPEAGKYDDWANVRFLIDRGDGIVSLAKSYGEPRKSALAPLNDSGVIQFHIAADKGVMDVEVNGQMVLEQYEQRYGVIKQRYSQVGFGVITEDPKSKVTFRKVQLTRP